MNNNKINTKWAALLAVIGSLAAWPLTAAELFEWQADTGAWEVGANWDASEPPTPGADVHIFNGGEAQVTFDTDYYYYNTYGYNYGFNNVTINNSTLYLDEYFYVNSLNLQNNSTLVFTQNAWLQDSSGGNLSQFTVTGNSTINADVAFLDNIYMGYNYITGDSTGTINFTGGSNSYDYVGVDNINIHSAATGMVKLICLSGTSNVTVASGTLYADINVYEDEKHIGNITIADGAKLKTEGTVIIRNGYVLGGDGTVEGDLYIENGGRLETSISLFSNGSFSESILLYGGATLEYVEGSPLALLGSGSFYLETLTGVLIDFSNVSLTVDSDYVIIDWTGSELSPYGHDVADFSVAGTDVEGNFRIENNQLIFNATAVPEPSTWFLLGAGLGALALLRRRRE